jgi:hypothetical protein
MMPVLIQVLAKKFRAARHSLPTDPSPEQPRHKDRSGLIIVLFLLFTFFMILFFSKI